MTTIKITAKRQTVLPIALCDEMHVGPGDRLVVEAIDVGDRRVWALTPVREQQLPGFGALRKYARGKRHEWAVIAERIEEGWQAEARR